MREGKVEIMRGYDGRRSTGSEGEIRERKVGEVRKNESGEVGEVRGKEA